MPGLESETVRYALDVARQKGLRVVKLRSGDMSLSAELAAVTVEPDDDVAEAPEAAATPHEPPMVDLTAPLVGYLREGKLPLEVGRVVKSGESMCVIEALGIANEVPATAAGEVVEVVAAIGDAVQYGQVIAKIRMTS